MNTRINEVSKMRLLIDEKGKKYMTEEDELHTKYGLVNLEGAVPGDRVNSHLGHSFAVLEPRLLDIYEKMPRSGSFMLKKDMGIIVANTGVGTGDIVVDAGTGSGALAMILANIVRPSGKVHTYEINEEFADLAKGNIKQAGLSEWVEVKVGDIIDGISVKADVVTLDMKDAWDAVPVASRALKPGGSLAVYNPYIEHARKVRDAISDHDFIEVRTVECIERTMEFKKEGTRPRTSGVGHTAYLTFARKV